MNISLKFDCREYKDGVKRENRKMIPDGGKISAFAVVDRELLPPSMPLQNTFCKPIIDDESGPVPGKYFLKFKINPESKYFVTQVASGKKILFPKNEVLDGRRFVCNVIFNIVEGAEGTKEARGNYINVIQFIREDLNIFDVVEGDEYNDDVFSSLGDAPAPAPAPAPGPGYEEDNESLISESDLIF